MLPPRRKSIGPVDRIRCAPRGFTLIELLVAMAVLAALAAVSFRGLGSILDAESHVRSETRRWNELAIVVAHMSRDLSMAAARTARDGTGARIAALSLEAPRRGPADQLLVTRLGDGDVGMAQADLRRVGYRLNADTRTLEYLVWPGADSAPNALPAVHAILENVAQLNLRALDADGSWSSAWPGSRPADALPRAVEAQFELAGGERITRIFVLR